MRLILVRHGETDLNRDRRVLGQGPEPLNETGLAQARSVAQTLARENAFALYSSPVKRTMQTAEAISKHRSTPVTQDQGLAEIEAGEMEGVEGRKLDDMFPEVMAQWRSDPESTRMPGGESLGQVQDRAWRAVGKIVESHPDGTAVVVSHNFPIQTIVCSVLGMKLKHFRRLKVDLGSITRLDSSSSGLTLVSLNETWHLQTTDPAE